MVFRADLTRLRSWDGPENMAIVRHTALNMLSQATPITSFKNRRKQAGREPDYQEQVVGARREVTVRSPDSAARRPSPT